MWFLELRQMLPKGWELVQACKLAPQIPTISAIVVGEAGLFVLQIPGSTDSDAAQQELAQLMQALRHWLQLPARVDLFGNVRNASLVAVHGLLCSAGDDVRGANQQQALDWLKAQSEIAGGLELSTEQINLLARLLRPKKSGFQSVASLSPDEREWNVLPAPSAGAATDPTLIEAIVSATQPIAAVDLGNLPEQSAPNSSPDAFVPTGQVLPDWTATILESPVEDKHVFYPNGAPFTSMATTPTPQTPQTHASREPAKDATETIAPDGAKFKQVFEWMSGVGKKVKAALKAAPDVPSKMEERLQWFEGKVLGVASITQFANELENVLERTKVHLLQKIIASNDYEIRLAPDVFNPIEPVQSAFESDLMKHLQAVIAQRRYTLQGVLVVKIVMDPNCDAGRFKVQAKIAKSPLGELLLQDPKQRWQLSITSMTIGRLPENKIRLPEQFNKISRIHAQIERDANGDYFLQDNNSRFGTYLNGTRITQRARLQHDDQILLGEPKPSNSRLPTEESVVLFFRMSD